MSAETALPPELLDPDLWSPLTDRQRRDLLAAALLAELEGAPGLVGTRVEVGPVERPYDLTAVAETDVGDLRTPLWSHARAVIFSDPSVHPANRRQLAPAKAVHEAAERLRSRLAVPFRLESRGLTAVLAPEPGVERTWTAERSRFRNRTAVTREDVVASAGDLDLRDLLAHFYTGPSLRMVGEDGTAFLLPAAPEAEGPLVSLCPACHRWAEGSTASCPECGGGVETIVAVRPPRR
ncbi:MAG TPA: hypothetical protein VHG28_23340 [Longimicrobiaceae bacterium]|nr:hypothetical protein [Longimicrobiaceae bacterium]